jgi:hypothetical protein
MLENVNASDRRNHLRMWMRSSWVDQAKNTAAGTLKQPRWHLYIGHRNEKSWVIIALLMIQLFGGNSTAYASVTSIAHWSGLIGIQYGLRCSKFPMGVDCLLGCLLPSCGCMRIGQDEVCGEVIWGRRRARLQLEVSGEVEGQGRSADADGEVGLMTAAN